MREIENHFEKKIFGKYWLDFLILFVILSLGSSGFIYFSHNAFAQKIIVVFTGLFYFIWGIIHHWRDKTLYFRVAFEYFMISFWGTLFVIFVLLRL